MQRVNDDDEHANILSKGHNMWQTSLDNSHEPGVILMMQTSAPTDLG